MSRSARLTVSLGLTNDPASSRRDQPARSKLVHARLYGQNFCAPACGCVAASFRRMRTRCPHGTYLTRFLVDAVSNEQILSRIAWVHPLAEHGPDSLCGWSVTWRAAIGSLGLLGRDDETRWRTIMWPRPSVAGFN